MPPAPEILRQPPLNKREAAAVRLSVPLAFRFHTVPAYRVGPSCLPPDAMTGITAPSWAAYWYQAHDRTCMTTCHCWQMQADHAYFAFDGGGDGVLFVQYQDEHVGVYSLAHTSAQPTIEWARFTLNAKSRMSSKQFHRLRQECEGRAPTFLHPVTGRYTPPDGAAAIWDAWDAAVAQFRRP